MVSVAITRPAWTSGRAATTWGEPSLRRRGRRAPAEFCIRRASTDLDELPVAQRLASDADTGHDLYSESRRGTAVNGPNEVAIGLRIKDRQDRHVGAQHLRQAADERVRQRAVRRVCKPPCEVGGPDRALVFSVGIIGCGVPGKANRAGEPDRGYGSNGRDDDTHDRAVDSQ